MADKKHVRTRICPEMVPDEGARVGMTPHFGVRSRNLRVIPGKGISVGEG
jgi:hypothetical protein